MIRLNQGFSLVEVIIVLTCSAIIGIVIVSLILQGDRLFFNQNSQINQTLALNTAVPKIQDSIRYASAISTTFTAGSTQYVSDSSTIIVKIPSINPQKEVIENTFDTLVITKNNQKPQLLMQYIFPDPASSRASESKILLTNLASIGFIYLDLNDNPVTPGSAAKVDFSIKVIENSHSGVKESSMSSRVNLKNI